MGVGRHSTAGHRSLGLLRFAARGVAALLIMIMASLALSAAAEEPPAARDLSIDSERLASGVPLGGLGAGYVELMTDGSLGTVAFQNNWERPIRDTKGSFFAVSAQAEGSRRVSRSLRHGDPFGLPAASRTLFHGVFPRAFVDYPDPDLPLRLSLEAFSPLVPHDEKHSALPVAFFTFRLENPGATAVDASILFSLENTIGVGGLAGKEWSDRTGNVAEWREEGYLRGLRFTNLGAAEAFATAPPSERAPVLGDITVLAPAGDGITVTGRTSWNVLTEAAALFDDFSADGELLAAAPGGAGASPGLEGSWHPAGAVVARKTIEPRGAATLTFVLAWNFPGLSFPDGGEFGHLYQRHFEDSFRAALYARDRIEKLREGTAAWQDLLLASNLPSWLSERFANDLSPLVTHTLFARDGRFAFLESPADGQGRFASPVDRLLAAPALQAFFPRLDAALLRQSAKSQSRSGEIARTGGSLRSAFDRASFDGGPSGRVEATAAFAIHVLGHALATGDSAIERELYSNVRDAIRFLVSLDRDGDGLPEAPALDVSGGSTSVSCDFFLSALRAAGELARRDGDVNFAGECDRRLGEASRTFSSAFFNGRFFERAADSRSGERSGDCALDQLFGTFALGSAGYPPALPEGSVRSAIRSLLELNARAGGRLPSDVVGPTGSPSPATEGDSPASTLSLAAAVLPSLAFRFGHPEAALELLRAADGAARAVNRSPWAQPAAYGAWDGRARSAAAHVSALGSWHAFQALSGFASDFDAGRLRTAPRLAARWSALHVPVFSPRFTADFRLDRVDSGPDCEATFEVLSIDGSEAFSLREWEIGIGETATPERVSVLVESARGVERGTVRVADGRARFTFESPLPLGAGDGARAHVGFGDAHQIVLTAGAPSAGMSFGADVRVESEAADAQSLRVLVENRGSSWQYVWLRFRSAPGSGSVSGRRELFVDGRSAGVVEGADLESGRGFWLKKRAVDRDAIERLAAVENRLRERLPLLRTPGSPPPPNASDVESFLRNASDFLARERGARTSEMWIGPPGATVRRPPAAAQKSAELAAALAGLEQALGDLRSSLSRSSAPPETRSAWIDALTPVDVGVAALAEPLPGESVPIRAAVANPQRLPLAGRLDVRFEEGIEGSPVSLDAALDRSFVARVDSRLPRRRYRVETSAELAVAGTAYRVVRAHPIGHAPLREFLVLGPFDDPDGSAFAAPFPPEKAIDLEASVPVRGGTATWQQYAGAGDSVDFDSLFAPDHEAALAYALTHVACPTEREAWLELGFDEGMKVFLNGQPVFEARRPERTARFGQERVKVTLAAGTNRLLFKSAQTSGPWRFFAELTDKDGFTFPDLAAAAAPPRDAR